MTRHIISLIFAAVMVALLTLPVSAQGEKYREDTNYSQYIRYDRYLDVEVWTDDDEYYDGENITINFRSNKDCYVVVYNIDTQGRVSLLYPTESWDDLKIERDRIYRIPNSYADFELTVRGPEGVEYIQIVASQQPLPIPDWESEELVAYADPIDFLDYINAVYFGCDYGCSLAFDLAIFTVNEWHPAYYRPVHVYHHYNWSLAGTVYIDYPWGATVYIDGIYWGIAPLFIPRIYYGWHYVTIYDHYGYCWEDRINVYKRKTVILDNTIIKTRAGVKSKYRDVRRTAYLDPAKNGYPDYNKSVVSKKATWETLKSSKSGDTFYKSRRDTESKRSAADKVSTSKVLKDGSKVSTGKRTYDSHSKSRKSESSSFQTERKRSANKARTQEKSSRKINESGKSEKRKSPASKSGSGLSGHIKKSSSGKSSGSESVSGKKSSGSSDSNSRARGRSSSGNDRGRSSERGK